ncbi:MAG: hypothetical protein K6F94_01235 [Bacteroidaceae bacterium]|nr:hypothetical protein [Bacteroidaceae bacterium]
MSWAYGYAQGHQFAVRVPYPSIFEAETTEEGTARFVCMDGERKVMELVMFVEPNVDGWDINGAVAQLSDSLTRCIDKGADFLTLAGWADERGEVQYVEKCFLWDGVWYDLSLYFVCRYAEAAECLIPVVRTWIPK